MQTFLVLKGEGRGTKVMVYVPDVPMQTIFVCKVLNDWALYNLFLFVFHQSISL